jgi:hypothetical protein
MTKLNNLKTRLASGDLIGSLRIAAKFPDLGEQKEPITRAWAAVQHPEFYREIGQDPDLLFAVGIAAIRRRYGI